MVKDTAAGVEIRKLLRDAVNLDSLVEGADQFSAAVGASSCRGAFSGGEASIGGEASSGGGASSSSGGAASGGDAPPSGSAAAESGDVATGFAEDAPAI